MYHQTFLPPSYSFASPCSIIYSAISILPTLAKIEYEAKENNSDIKKLEKRIIELEKQVERINELENQLKEMKSKK